MHSVEYLDCVDEQQRPGTDCTDTWTGLGLCCLDRPWLNSGMLVDSRTRCLL